MTDMNTMDVSDLEAQLFSSLDLPLAPLLDKLARLHFRRLEEAQQAQFSAPEDETFECWLSRACEANANLSSQLIMILVGSQFVVDSWVRKPQLLRDQVDGGELWLAELDHRQQLAYLLEGISDDQGLGRVLRQYRQRQMCRIIFRDLNRLAQMLDTTRECSLLAEASIDAALDTLHPVLCKELGTPMSKPEADEPAVEQHMVVLGMGKLGAYELNLSSDIDLIFAYPEGGETVGGRRSVANQNFFLRLGQRLIKALDTLTGDGFVFRVDMRLRPYGQSGALALSFDAMEEYYQDQGREWERYAMIKARVVGGDRQQGEQLMAMLRPFTYRRYIDFSAIESLRSMKEMINREVIRKGKQQDVKLGLGGIREIEFVAQTFQLIRGGRETELQDRRLLVILGLLAENGCLPLPAVEELSEAYVFLRNVEHAIQGWQDRQTQILPDDESGLQRIAYTLGFCEAGDVSDTQRFMAQLDAYRERVHHHFSQVIAPIDEHEEQQAKESLEWWEDEWDLQTLACDLSQRGFEQAEESARRLIALRDGQQVRAMQNVGLERLQRFLPLLLNELEQHGQGHASRTLERVLVLVESVLRRTAYLVLLIENPHALGQLVVLCEASPWIAEQLARHPVLLDELLSSGSFAQVPDRQTLHNELRSELQQNVLRLNWDDLEGHMDALRYFKLANGLRVAAAEVSGLLPLMKVSDYLTALAEVILEHVLVLAWQQMTARHGEPARQPVLEQEAGLGDGAHEVLAHEVLKAEGPDFLIVGYGKSGGIELGHGSDLDLVFIHNAPSGYTDGEKPLDNKVFFARLGQKIIHILNTQTAMGQLYEVDMRLRPSGNSGMLVSSIEAYEAYLLNEAWTWEHQALVRARALAGNAKLIRQFEQVRESVLCLPRDLPVLRDDVSSMRGKMIEHLAPAKTKGKPAFKPGTESFTSGGQNKVAESGKFHLKHSEGGIVDIEFMVQYAVLAWANKQPELTRYTDNIRILSILRESGQISELVEQSLREAYITYRSHTHRLALQRQSSEIDGQAFLSERKQVMDAWQQLMESDLNE
jgi:glutamate-ammonia-ligase adenylyltransferase